MNNQRKKKVSIVVLGDIGRSPRMQYHCLSFLEEGYDVEFVGYAGSTPIQKIKSNGNVKFNYVIECPNFKEYFPTAIAYITKVIWQIVTLFMALLATTAPDYLLVQNPPAMPTLGVCYIYCKLYRSKFAIDWHNYAYSVLGLTVGSNHLLVKVSKRFEFFFGRRADFNFCVTKAMKDDLDKTHGISAITFYDRPPDFFKNTTLKDKHKLFLALGVEYDIFYKKCKFGETVFTTLNKNSEVILRDDRPAFLISSTSWTEDEDFSILLSALEVYEKVKESSYNLPDLICAITGKGPLKDFYMNIIKSRNWKHVTIITPWLEAEDYPKFIGSADLGVCLHKSSSGLDLPMKVVDMFGSSVPVCAMNYNCINELVKHEQNGFVFNNEKELFSQIYEWFTDFPKSKSSKHKVFKESLSTFNKLKWHDNWKFNVQPLFS